MKMKKIFSTIALTSIIGASISTPFNVLATEAFASEDPLVTTQSNFVVENPNLVDPRTGLDYANSMWKFDNGLTITDNPTLAIGGSRNATRYFDINAIASPVFSSRGNQAYIYLNSGMVQTSTPEKNVQLTTSQQINTVAGKEYTVTGTYSHSNSSIDNSSEKFLATTSFGVTDASNTVLEQVETDSTTNEVASNGVYTTTYTVTFTATSSLSKLFFSLDAGDVPYSHINSTFQVSNINFVKSDAQVEKELTEELARQQAAETSLSDLTDTSHILKDTTTQASLDHTQTLINAILDADKKAELQAELDTLQTALNVRTIEWDKQAAAEDALANLVDANDIIKAMTDQNAIDNVQVLIDAITTPTKKAELQEKLADIQTQLGARNAELNKQQAVEDALNNLVDLNNIIKNTTTQNNIDDVQTLIEAITDPTKKAEFQTKLDDIQSQLTLQNNAKISIDNLFSDTKHTELANDVDQTDIDNAKNLVNQVTDSALNAELNLEITKAQSLLDEKNASIANQIAAENAVKALFNNDDTKATIKNNTDQAVIDAARQLVNAVIDPAKKNELQQAVNKAQRQLVLGEVTIDTYTVGGNYITGTTKAGVTKVGIYVDGKLIRTAAASNGTYQIYASTTPELQVTGQTFEVAPIAADGTIGLKSNSVVSAKVAPKKIAKPMIDDYFKGASYITGTVSTEAKKIALYIDGQFVRYGAITDDTFKIYASDVALIKVEGQTFEVVAVDNLGNEGERASSDVKVKTVKGSISPNEITALSTYNTGTVTGDVHMIALYVDGELVRYGAVTGTEFKVYIYDIPALRIADTTFEVKALDTVGNVLYTSTQTVQ
ncbi:toxin Cry1Ac domain D-VI-related protein [Listeria grandensis]|uniref:toxin Cry1Ac domain D-VI-related protein n=1 Tax=Listeria grandensis TaxID=1494963 RepID=UPI00164E3376|nr:toxin Cry1Ac domain D-VI-related protein [Listeria grandensis]MBC6316976.1 hypothetical protein [Listeria grandensis]